MPTLDPRAPVQPTEDHTRGVDVQISPTTDGGVEISWEVGGRAGFIIVPANGAAHFPHGDGWRFIMDGDECRVEDQLGATIWHCDPIPNWCSGCGEYGHSDEDPHPVATKGDPVKHWTITLGEDEKEEALTVYVPNSYESDMFMHRLIEDLDVVEHCSAYGETLKAMPRELGNRGENVK